MRVLITASLLGAAALSLVACNKPTAAAGAAATPAAGGGAAASGPVSLSQIPHRRPGLWKQVMAMDGAAAPAGPGVQLCVDDASESKLGLLAQRSPNAHCMPQFNRNLDGSISFSGSCDTGKGGVAQTSGTIHGDFNTGYTESITSTISGSSIPQMNGVHTMTITATWTGPCAAGQRGGDLIMPNGMKRNMMDDHPAPAAPGG